MNQTPKHYVIGTHTVRDLMRQRDELHETANRYLERARIAEYALARALKDRDNAI